MQTSVPRNTPPGISVPDQLIDLARIWGTKAFLLVRAPVHLAARAFEPGASETFVLGAASAQPQSHAKNILQMQLGRGTAVPNLAVVPWPPPCQGNCEARNGPQT